MSAFSVNRSTGSLGRTEDIADVTDKIDHTQFEGRAGALAEVVAAQPDVVAAITEALAHFAESAVKAEIERCAIVAEQAGATEVARLIRSRIGR